MPSLPPDAAGAMPYWGVIESAAARGATTAELWADIRGAAESLGLEHPGVSAIGVSRLRGIAGAIQSRGREFDQLPGERRAYSTLWTDAPWQRPAGMRRAEPKWAVRFRHAFTIEGEPGEQWRTVVGSGRPPRTVGEIRAHIEGEALNMSRKYRIQHLGISGLQLLVI